MAYSNTRLTTYKRCRLKYHWHYVEKRGQPDAVALRRGRAAHKAMASYYEGKSVKTAIADAWHEYAPSHPESVEEMEKLDEILLRYFTWAKDVDRWKVLKVEHTVEVKYARNRLMGIWDLLVEKQGKVYIIDHKFQKSHSFSNLPVDSQVSHYLALAKLAGVKVDGLMYNIVNLELTKNATPAFRQIVNRTETFLDAYLQSLIPQIKEIKKLDKGTLPVYANWTRDCCWDCSYVKECIAKPFIK